jgi:beta-lactamase superfamily II metal-dependent hydrolase
MGFEIDFLAVGEKKSGDAIAIRFGDLFSAREMQKVVIIDGGFVNTGEDLVNHIANNFKTDTVDLVILTHPDNDHVGGLPTVLNKLKVKELWMHKAWDHTHGKSLLFEDGRISDKSIKQTLKESLETA